MKSTNTIKDRCDQIFSQIVKLRDCLETTGSPHFGRCCTCDGLYDDALLEAGHFIPGRHPGVKYDMRGCHAQCGICNRAAVGSEHAKEVEKKYYEFMLKRYGQSVIDELRALDNEITHLKEFHYQTMYDQFKVILKNLKHES
jgi:hypothetical protein